MFPGNKRHRKSQNIDKNVIIKQSNTNQPQFSQTDLKASTQKDKQQTFLSGINENYTSQQIQKVYKILTYKKGYLDIQSLQGFLEEQGESRYSGVEMIALLDKERRGYVTKEQFVNFFQKGIFNQEAQLPIQFQKDRKLVKAIDANYQSHLKNFIDPQYCQYAAKQIKRFRYSQQL